MSERLIDKDERTRKKPMRILVLGMCRTGTTTISVALRTLGYTPHQMREVLVNPKELTLWQEAINTTLLPPQDRPSKQRNLAPYGKPEFDKLLGDHDVAMDLPSCLFAQPLIKAYPEAKVILTTRDYDAWESSMQQSIWCLCTWWLFAIARYFNISKMAPLTRLIYSAFRVHNGNTYGGPESKRAYEAHYDLVRRLVPKGKLLEIDPDTAGWEPLCAFLEVDIPKETYPKMSEDQAMRKNLTNAWWGIIELVASTIILPTGAILLGLGFLFYSDAMREMRDEYILFPIRRYLDS
jgi:hypothetical protein